MHALFDAPDPRRIASLPVAWIASTIADGGAVDLSRGFSG